MKVGRTGIALVVFITAAAVSSLFLLPVVHTTVSTPVIGCAVPPHGFGCTGTPDGGHFPASASISFRLFGVGAVYADVPCGANGSVTYPRFASCGWTYSLQGPDS